MRRLSDFLVPVFSDCCNRSVFTQERVSAQEPGARDRVALRVGYGDPNTVRQQQSLLESRAGHRATYRLCPLVGQLGILGPGQRCHQERAEVIVQTPDHLVNIKARGRAVPCSYRC